MMKAAAEANGAGRNGRAEIDASDSFGKLNYKSRIKLTVSYLTSRMKDLSYGR